MYKSAFRSGAFVLAVTVVGLCGCDSQGESTRELGVSDSETILGKWKVTSAERYRESFPQPVGMFWSFTQHEVSFLHDDQSGTPTTYKLDDTQSPKQFYLGPEDHLRSQRGIYSLESNTLTLCLAGWQEPVVAEFKTGRNNQHQLLTLSRVTD